MAQYRWLIRYVGRRHEIIFAKNLIFIQNILPCSLRTQGKIIYHTIFGLYGWKLFLRDITHTLQKNVHHVLALWAYETKNNLKRAHLIIAKWLANWDDPRPCKCRPVVPGGAPPDFQTFRRPWKGMIVIADFGRNRSNLLYSFKSPD